MIVRKLTLERISELKAEIETCQVQLADLKKNISLLKNDNLSETDMKIIESQMIEQLNQKRLDEQKHELWLKEREEKHQSVARKKSIVNLKMPTRKEDQQQQQQTPTKSTLTEQREEAGLQANRTAPNENLVQAKAIKQESMIAAEVSEPLPVRTTRERSKEQEKMQIIVIGEQEKQVITEKSVVESAKNQPTDKQPQTSKGVEKQLEITPVKMDVDIVEKSREEERSVEMRETNEEPIERREESIASNKRKRTSTTSSNVSTIVQTTSQQQQPTQPLPAAQQQQQQSAPSPAAQTPPATQTRRSGRISKPLRPSLTLSAPTTPKPPVDSLEQQAKRTQIDESNIIIPASTTSQLLLNDDSTKDSTTSDLTDTYTSPNSPASSILLNSEHTDTEQARELKEQKAWRKSIYLLLKQAQTHKFSSLFQSPVTDDEAKGYSTVVYRPIDLTIIRRKLDNGQIKTTAEFQRDIMLMFQNAIFYNNRKHAVHQMTLEMQSEILSSIEDFVNEETSRSVKETSAVSASFRRKSRTLS